MYIFIFIYLFIYWFKFLYLLNIFAEFIYVLIYRLCAYIYIHMIILNHHEPKLDISMKSHEKQSFFLIPAQPGVLEGLRVPYRAWHIGMVLI